MNWSLLTNLGNITFPKNWHSVRRDNQHLKIKRKNHTTTNDILYTKIYGKGFRYNVLVIMYTFAESRVPQATLRSIVFFFCKSFASIVTRRDGGGSSQKPVISTLQWCYKTLRMRLMRDREEHPCHFFMGVPGLWVLYCYC